MRLLAVLCHARPAVQARVRELEGLVPVLQRCQLDARNPNIREWAILAVRYLTEDESNREFIQAIESTPREVVNAEELEAAGLEVKIDRSTGKVRMKQQPRTPGGGSSSNVGSGGGGGGGGSLAPIADVKDEVQEALEEADPEGARVRLHRVEL